MRLRRLQKKDASFMLEWMHDKNCTEGLHRDFQSMTINDCLCFIERAQTDESNVNLAVVDDNDEYMGTVSLKRINRESASAEFAIVLRTVAQGKGFAGFAMREIIKIAFEEEGLNTVYWNVYKNNVRANRCYQKNGYEQISFEQIEGITSVDQSYLSMLPLFNWYWAKK